MSEYFLADDLSGALDAAAAFHRAGRAVTVALTLEAWNHVAGEADVVGITTETRNAAPEAAAAAVARVIAHGRARGAMLVYKKIDSTLRGPVAAEVGALAAAMPEARILFAPANPAVGRTVRDGVLRVHGVPVAETEFARDPVSPVKESKISRLLAGLAQSRMVIPDTETEQHLAEVVARMAEGGEPWVAVGSGALARPVAALWRGHGARSRAVGTGTEERTDAISARQPVLFVCGSAHAANRAQAARVSRECGIAVRVVDLRSPHLTATAAIADLRERGAAMLQLPPSAEGGGASSRAALKAIVEAAHATAVDTGVRRLMITGGETAFSLCEQLEVTVLHVRAEIEPGLVAADSEGDEKGRWRLVIKPGGFGTERAWLAAAEWLRREP